MEIQAACSAAGPEPAAVPDGRNAGVVPGGGDALCIGSSLAAPGAEALDVVMATMISEMDGDVKLGTSDVMQRKRDAARMREKIIDHIRRKARQARKARSRSGIAKVFMIIGAACAAIASIVGAPFTGGGSIAAGIGAALGVAGALAGGVAAGVGMASSMSSARAEQAGLRKGQAEMDRDRALGAAEAGLDQGQALVDAAAALENRVMEILETEDRMAMTVVRRTP